MKNFLKYFFSIILMISCLILFSMLAYKVLFVDEEKPSEGLPPENGAQSEELSESSSNGETGNKENPKGDSDADKPENKDKVPDKAPFTTQEASYFNDALFIGDSRTVGLHEYGHIEGAAFFANTGMNVYNVREKTVDVAGVGTVTLDGLLSSKHYGKIYLMLGINELGYNMDQTVAKYKELVDWIVEKNPDGILFIQANLHVAAARSNTDDIFNNKRINQFNDRISEFIDNKRIFYIDVNKVFDDENGNLGAQYTSDNTHVLAKYYPQWAEWILTKAIAPEENA